MDLYQVELKERRTHFMNIMLEENDTIAFSCQDPNQKEDDLSALHVKQGFSNSYANVMDEFGSNLQKMAAGFNHQKIWNSFKDILVKKEELNTFAVSKKGKKNIPMNRF